MALVNLTESIASFALLNLSYQACRAGRGPSPLALADSVMVLAAMLGALIALLAV